MAVALGMGISTSAFAADTYEGESLRITLSGAPVLGKTAVYTPGTDGNATITLSSTFALSAIPGIPEQFQDQIVPGPGVLAGSPETILSFKVSESAEGVTFSGEGETPYLTYEYTGNITGSVLTLDFTDVILADTQISKNWEAVPYDYDPEWQELKSTPLYYKWESEKAVELMEGWEMPADEVLGLVVRLPLFEAEEGEQGNNLMQMLDKYFKSAYFHRDGNITAEVLSEDGSVVTSPRNLVQYVLTGDNKGLFFLDPAAIEAADNDMKKAPKKAEEDPALPDLSNIFGSVLAQVAPMLSEGVPFNYTLSEVDGKQNMLLYLGTDLLLPLLKENVLPLLKNEEFVNTVIEMLSQDPDMGLVGAMLPGILKSLVNVIETTSVIEIGINFTEGKPSGCIALPSDANRTETARFNLAGQRVDRDYKGIVVVRYSDGSAAKVVVK